MKLIVIGAAGQLGSDLVRAFRPSGHDVRALTRADLDVTNFAATRKTLMDVRPELVINCTAENRVDDCEELLHEAFTLNAIVPASLAAITKESGATLMHFSTDYVFDGRKNSPYYESDTPLPLNAYGVSKSAGEQLIRQRNPRHYLIRVSGLYGVQGARGKGGNFVEAVITRARQEGSVQVVTDQVTAPTSTRDLADRIVEITGSDLPFGTYHLAAAGEVRWYDFANEIISRLHLNAEVEPITSVDFVRRAPRPAYSVLRSHRLAPLRHWSDALTDYLIAKGHQQ